MMFQRKSRLTSLKQNKLIEHFVAATTALAAAEIIEVQANR
jgi:transposase-like protein